MKLLQRAAIVFGFGLALLACDGGRGPCGVDDCPAFVDCMPPVTSERQCLCSAEGREWMLSNCPDTHYGD